MSQQSLVFVISFAKAGTHLVGALMRKLGYEVVGPILPPAVQQQLATNPAGLPPQTCVMFHKLPLSDFPRDLAVHWHQTGSPAVFLNYRDPRDILCSYVRFLMRNTENRTFEPSPAQLSHSFILQSLPDHDARLMHAITDTTFPYHTVFEDSTWLLHHPLVCKVAFERLVGAQGGGSADEQRDQIAEILRHLGVVGDPATFAEGIFRKDSATFAKGQIGSFREEFKPEHHAAFNARFGDVLELYGYERVEEPVGVAG
jgi:hypothetical protein